MNNGIEAMDRAQILPAMNPERPAPGLYIVATPIGNASDITLRALEVLATCDVIYCEDTRVTSKLLSVFSIKKPLETYHDHNGAKVRPKIIARLTEGEVVALVSDAGTPLVSDPGYQLVKEVADLGLAVTTLPGPSAVIAGLTLSRQPTDRFSYFGFLPVKKGARRSALSEAASVPSTLVFYETGPRLTASLADMADMLGDREATVTRELTKKFEEVRSERLSTLAAHYDSNGAPKGEIVVIVSGPEERIASDDDLRRMLSEELVTSSLKDAVATVTEVSGAPRKRVYDLALKTRDET